MFLLLSALLVQAPAEPLAPTWRREFNETGRMLGLHESGRCMVVAENGIIEVLRPSGAVWWTWPYAKVNRYIEPYSASISPNCDAIVIDGRSGYHYSWIVQRGGRAVFVRTPATPHGSAFDRSGQSVVISTGGGTLQRHDLDGTLQWKASVGPFRILADIEFSDDNALILASGRYTGALARADGSFIWTETSDRIRASRDFKTFLLLKQGRSIVSIVEAMDERQNVLWRLYADVEAFVSADGRRVLAAVDLRQERGAYDESGPYEREMRLLSREGRTITAFPGYDRAIAFSDDGSRMWLRTGLTLRCVNEKGDNLAEISVNSIDWSRSFFSRALDYVAVANHEYARTTSLEWYAVPSACRN